MTPRTCLATLGQVTHERVGARPRLYAYIDETGDRGNSEKSSPIFGMAAVVVDERSAVSLRRAVTTLRQDLRVPDGTVMSWKTHVKTHDRRRRAAELLGGVDGLKVCYVYSVKNQLRPGSYRDDRHRFYNYVAFTIYKSILWTARSWKGPAARIWTRFGHVRHHDHRTTARYLTYEAERDSRVPSEMEQGLRWVSADRYLESQVADIYCGFLKAALWPQGEFGYVEPAYLLSVWHQIRNSERCVIPLGLMSMPSNDIVRANPWFPCGTCPKHSV